jgi:integrase/recombinase XerC
MDTEDNMDRGKYRKAANNSDLFAAMGKNISDSQMTELAQKFSHPKTERAYRDRAIFTVFSQTGMRASEICKLKFSNIILLDNDKPAFRFYRTKNKDWHIVPITEQMIDILEEYHKFAGIKSDHIFWSLPNFLKTKRTRICQRTFQRVVNSWNVKTGKRKLASCHSLRHTAGQKVFDAKGSIAAQKLLGHSSPVTTALFYTKPYYDATDSLNWDELDINYETKEEFEKRTGKKVV